MSSSIQTIISFAQGIVGVTTKRFKQLSMYLQKIDADVISVMDHIEICRENLFALKEGNGNTLNKF